MAKYFFQGGRRAASAVGALTAALLLVTGCSDKPADKSGTNEKIGVVPGVTGPAVTTLPSTVVDVPVAVATPAWDTISLMVRTDPVEPQNERFLDDWRFRLYTIDDLGRPTSPSFYADTAPDGTALIGLPGYMFQLPLIITAYNDVLPLVDDECLGIEDGGIEDETLGHCRQFEIFVPPYCHDKAIWLLGPFESTLWDYYEKAAERRAEAWNPSQVDCGTWLANLQALILTDEVSDELNQLSGSECEIFRKSALIDALQENQNLLTPTRPPICMAERRHNGGGMERGRELEGFQVAEGKEPAEPAAVLINIDEDQILPEWATEVFPDVDPIYISVGDGVIPGSGLVYDICNPITSTRTPPLPNTDRVWDSANLSVFFADNLVGVNFRPEETFILDDEDFMGTVSDMRGIDVDGKLDVSSYNVKLGNGRELDHDVYDDACAVTTILEFTNKSDDELDVELNTGVTFSNLFQSADASVWLTSDGDAVVGDNDYWAIFQDGSELIPGIAEKPVFNAHRALGVELLGHRQEDFRDVLHMVWDDATDNLFLGLRADYELNEEEVDGERAFLVYTMHFWDDGDVEGRRALRRNIANCYEAADVWARQFFTTRYFNFFDDECCIDDDCLVDNTISAKEAAEFAVRSQCFSNSRSNQRWRTDDSGYWSMNTDHGVNGDVIVNPGWLAPYMDFEIYIQKFDEAVFKGPRTIRRTDEVGQLMAEIPTLVEGDRVLLKSEDNCCDDYDLVIPCVPEFTGFAGAPGIPYIPVTLGPVPMVPPAAIVPVPVAEAGLAGFQPLRKPAVAPAVGAATPVAGGPEAPKDAPKDAPKGESKK